MVLSAIMGIVCILLILFLYIFSGGWKQYGGLTGIRKWLLQGGLSNPNSRSQKVVVRKVPNTSEVADILEEIYNEFSDKLHKQNQEFEKRLEDSLIESRKIVQYLEKRIERLERAKEHNGVETDSLVIEPLKPRIEEKTHVEDPVYFRILDELQKGATPEEIAASLQVSMNDVEQVLLLMGVTENRN